MKNYLKSLLTQKWRVRLLITYKSDPETFEEIPIEPICNYESCFKADTPEKVFEFVRKSARPFFEKADTWDLIKLRPTLFQRFVKLILKFI
jgi:hypothetical protein